MATEPTLIQSKPSDAALAAEYRTKLLERLDQLCAMINEARDQHGIVLQFGLAPNGFGRMGIQNVEVMKRL